MSRYVYGRTKAGHNIYHCAGRRKDGEPCGRRVQTYGALCWQHRRAARRARQEGSA